MNTKIKVRQEVYDLYWEFATMRQEIFYGRLAGKELPIVDDKILNTYKFTNAFRASDRVSQYLIKNIIYCNGYKKFSIADVVFRIILFKIFNKIETWELLEKEFGELTLATFSFKKFVDYFNNLQGSGTTIYTSAYMSCATKAFGYDKKHENHLALIEKMFFVDSMQNKIVGADSLQEVFEILIRYPLIGKFMAYQLAIDINYSEIIDFDENSFTVAGPGAMRGIKKCFIDVGGLSYEEIISHMVGAQEVEFKRLGLNFKKLGLRPLKAIDCQNIFCEVDKYTRVSNPELASDRVRIKQKFKPNFKNIKYFYPPKWGINKYF